MLIQYQQLTDNLIIQYIEDNNHPLLLFEVGHGLVLSPQGSVSIRTLS